MSRWLFSRSRSVVIIAEVVPSLTPYQDLSVQLEGEFFLRYSLFDLAGMCPIPGNVGRTSACHASCTGGTFTVYPTKEAPTLPPSTAITKVGTAALSTVPSDT